MAFENLKQGMELIKEGVACFSKGPLEFYLKELIGAHDFLMGRFCPFKVGDRVRLTKVPTSSEAPSWTSFTHFMKEGALATVHSAECGADGFRFGIVFDEESWKDREEVLHPMEKKHIFSFGEGSLVAANAQRVKPDSFKAKHSTEHVSVAPDEVEGYGMSFTCYNAFEVAKQLNAIVDHTDVVVTTNAYGRVVAVTRQDDERRILKVIWEADA